MRRPLQPVLTTLALLSFASPGLAQDIEPRRWTPLPVGTNVIGIGYAHTDADISIDPVLELEDVNADVETAVVSYLHAFDLAGKTARFDVRVPVQDARWEGLLRGQDASTQRTGLADPRLRLSVNLLGPPAMNGKELQAYHAAHPVSTVAGAALSVALPFGEYKQEKLLNLGANRYLFRPQLGVVHTRGRWSYELTGSVLFFTENDEFFGDNKREQDPLYALQGHLTYIAARRWWVSVGAARNRGGESTLNGDKKDDERRELFYGISAGTPVSRRSSVKLAYVGTRSDERVGKDTDSYVLAFITRF